MPRMAISEHAVERFVERVRPGWGLVQARHYLEDHVQSAVRLPQKTLLGQSQYELDEPRCVLVAKRLGGDDVLTCVTILPPRTPRGESPLTDIEVELLEELASRPPKAPEPRGEPSRRNERPAPRFEHIAAFLSLQRQRLDWEGVALREAEKTERVRMTTATPAMLAQSRKVAASASPSSPAPNQKTLRHLANQEIQIRQHKHALRAVLRYAVARAAEGDARASAAIEAVRAQQAGFLSDGFLNFEAPSPDTIVE